MQLLDLYEEWQTALTNFNNLLKQRVKAHGQLKTLARVKITGKEGGLDKSLTRDSYNARLRHPQNWPGEAIEQFAQILDTPQLLTLFQQQQAIIAKLPDLITGYIKSVHSSNAFVIRLLKMHKDTFYAKQRDPKTWKKGELENIEKIIETLRKLQ